MRWRYSKYNLTQGVQRLKTKTAIAISAIGLVLGGGAGLALVTLGAAHATGTTVVVKSGDSAWDSSATTSGGQVNFIPDSSAPLGNGALQLLTNSSTSAKANYMNHSVYPTNLSAVNELSYWTKQNSASFAGGDVSYQLAVWLNGTSGFTTLVYEPYQNPTQGSVTQGQWQNWNVANGLFWSTHTITCSNGTINGGAGGPASYSLADIQTACPSAVVLGVGVNVGSNNPSYNVETDGVDFNGTTYNFEPTCVAVSTSKGNMTAAQVGGNVSGELNATGCQIGVYYNGGTGTVSGADIHGATYYGVFADRGAAVNVTDSYVHQIGDTPFSGAQHGVAVFYTLGSTGTVSGNTIDNYQKNGMAITEPDTNVAVSDNTVTGNGAVPNIAQNGIEFGYGAMGSARGNTINGNWYTGDTWSSTGLLLFDVSAKQVKTSNNTFRNNQNNLAVVTAQACPHQYGGFYEQYGLCTYKP